MEAEKEKRDIPDTDIKDLYPVATLRERIPWRRKWQPTPVFLPGTSMGFPWNMNPQDSCLGHLTGRGAWRATVYGSQSQTRLGTHPHT